MTSQFGESFDCSTVIFHRYWINLASLKTQKKKAFGTMRFTQQNGSLGSTIYKCRLVPDDFQEDYGRSYAMKVVSYEKNPSKQNKQYRLLNPYTKSFQQIETQFLALQLLSKCHRVAKFIQIIQQNPSRQDDNKFFYKQLKKPKTIGQRYLCIITQYCNQRDLDSLIQKRQAELTEEEVILYAVQMVQGLYQLKKKKIIHRDLRLCNILVHNDQIKFSDFDSAFIGGKSTWKDIKSGIDIGTSPPEIIQLASKPDEELEKYDNDDLYHIQQKSDIYFFGVALFKLIFGFTYERFDSQTLSNLIAQKRQETRYDQKIWRLLEGCLQQNIEKRTNFEQLYRSFIEIEKRKYYRERSIGKLYLSEEQICFALQKALSQSVEQDFSLEQNYSKIYFKSNGLETIQNQLKKGLDQRYTQLYKKSFTKNVYQKIDLHWNHAQGRQEEEIEFLHKVQSFIKKFTMHSFYYECIYKTILSINMRAISNRQDKKFVSQSKSGIEKQLSLVLSFIFKMLFKTPFVRDKRYKSNDLAYETSRLFRKMIKEDLIYNKMHCYSGKSRLTQDQGSPIHRLITTFTEHYYESGDQFSPFYDTSITLLSQIDQKMKKLLRSTIINLRLAYSNVNFKKKNNYTNVKEILFILITLHEIDTSKTSKNEIFTIWRHLAPFLDEELEIEAKQAEIIFYQFRQLYHQDELKVAVEQNQYSVAMFSMEGVEREEVKHVVQELNQQQKSSVIDGERIQLHLPDDFSPHNEIEYFENQKSEISSIRETQNRDRQNFKLDQVAF